LLKSCGNSFQIRRIDSHVSSNADPLHLVEPVIIELRRAVEAWFGMAAAFSGVPPFLR
jgi:hypothetical protein